MMDRSGFQALLIDKDFEKGRCPAEKWGRGVKMEGVYCCMGENVYPIVKKRHQGTCWHRSPLVTRMIVRITVVVFAVKLDLFLESKNC